MSLQTLIWLFPIAFMFHDFEELIFGERWLKANADEITKIIYRRFPAFVTKRMSATFRKTTSELTLAVSLIMSLTVLSAYLATEHQQYTFFLIASSVFFLHGFMHIGQSIALRRYIPAVITSVFIVIPYGLLLYPCLISADIVNLNTLLIYFAVAIITVVPFILFMLALGDLLYKRLSTFLLGNKS